jgi:hypothetical protein
MKKLLLLPTIFFTFMSCSKEKEKETTEQTLFVNVYYKYASSSTEYVASPTLVQIYEDADFDFEASRFSLASSSRGYRMTLKNGELVSPKYTSTSFSGINIIENVKNGKYHIIVWYKPDGFTFELFYYYGYRKVTVNKNIHCIPQKILFTWGQENDAFKFVEK